MPSGGYFTFPAHGEPGQGVSAEAEFRLGRKIAFLQLPPAFPLPVFSASADADCCSLPRFFGDGVLFAAVHFCFVHLFQNSPFRFLILRNKKANESLSSAALFGREKISHSPVCDSVFLCLLGQNFADMSSRPTKILKITAFRDFFVTGPKCQKGAKNLVKPVFLR